MLSRTIANSAYCDFEIISHSTPDTPPGHPRGAPQPWGAPRGPDLPLAGRGVQPEHVPVRVDERRDARLRVDLHGLHDRLRTEVLGPLQVLAEVVHERVRRDHRLAGRRAADAAVDPAARVDLRVGLALGHRVGLDGPAEHVAVPG